MEGGSGSTADNSNPKVPLKPDTPNQQLNCTYGEEHRKFIVNLLESEMNTQCDQFNQANSCSISMLPGSSSNWVSSKQANFHGDGLRAYPSKVSFRQLMALAEGKPVNTADFVMDSSSTFCYQPDMLREQFSGYVSSQTQELFTMPEVASNCEVTLDSPMISEGGTPVNYMRFFDLNLPSREVVNVASGKDSLYFSGSNIPEENKESDQQQQFDMKYMSEDESYTGDDTVNRKLSNRVLEPTQMIDQMSTTGTPMNLQENTQLDKGNREESPLMKSTQQKPRRKKHRPKVIIEGQSKKSPKLAVDKTTAPRAKSKSKPVQLKVLNEPFEIENSSPIHIVTRAQKRKYTRRKGINESEGTMDKEEDTEPPCSITRSSCRRSLNFNIDSQYGGDSFSFCPSSNHVTGLKEEKLNAEYRLSSLHCRQGMDGLSGKNETGISQKLGNMLSHEHDEYLGDNQHSSGLSAGKYILQNEGFIEPKICIENKTGTFYNTLQTYKKSLQLGSQSIGRSQGLHLPKTCKRKRTERTYDLNCTSQIGYNEMNFDRHSPRDPITGLFTLNFEQGTFEAQCELADDSGKAHRLDGTHNAWKKLQDLYASDGSLKIKRGRSKCLNRPRDCSMFFKELPASSCKAANSTNGQNIPVLHALPMNMEALVSTPIKIHKKKGRRSMAIESTEQIICSHINHAAAMKGLPLALKWNYMSPADTVIEQFNRFKRLDMKEKNILTSVQQQDAVLPHDKSLQESHALVPYQSSGALATFNGSLEVKRRQRPKVYLDEETTRVWKLLLENIDNEGIDGADEEQAKWWEAERRMFNGRADSFIARMHLVQGDRRFSPWKGSVVDSVVGVFLTQNVSDHLSSSAFMSIAARFPITINAEKELYEKSFHTEIMLPEVLEFDPDPAYGLTKEISSHSVHSDITGFLDSKNEEKSEDISVKSPEHISKGLIEQGMANALECEWLKPPNKSTYFVDEGYIEETYSSQATDISSQNSAESRTSQIMETIGSCYSNCIEERPYAENNDKYNSSTSLEKLLEMTGNVLQGNQLKESSEKISNKNGEFQAISPDRNQHGDGHLSNHKSPAITIELSSQSLCDESTTGTEMRDKGTPEKKGKYLDSFMDKEISTAEVSGQSSDSSAHTRYQSRKSVGHKEPRYQAQSTMDVTGNGTHITSDHKEVSSNEKIDSEKCETEQNRSYTNDHHVKGVTSPKEKQKTRKKNEIHTDWDELRKKVIAEGRATTRTDNTNDSVDWDAVRCADVKEIAETIKARGMNNNLAERIKEFLNRLVRDHGSMDMEWLRDIQPDKAKEYLLSFRGLGLKSVECVRLLTLHHLAFPVDTNVGRIAVRLGWVPLQPLPESLQLHLLELYPVLESIQKYLWPRLCKLDQKTLYELHYQMITFGKVFCTKSKPNCNACPMRADCRHFASAFASATLALPGPEEKRHARSMEGERDDDIRNMNSFQLPLIQSNQSHYVGSSNSEPIIEEPPSPGPILEITESDYHTEVQQFGIDDTLSDSTDEIPTIHLNMEVFTHNLQKFCQQNTGLHERNMSMALVALTPEAASIPVPKLKNMRRLRTEHRVYELPDSHPLLEEMDKREPDDPSPYLLAIWAPGETANSIEQPQRRCNSEEIEKLCNDEQCSSCNSIREANSQTVRGTILIPCRTAMSGSFPLNGTYFQVNEVFSDHDSSLSPIDIPRNWLWNLARRTVYFGTSIPTIFKGLSTSEIQYCFWRGFVCVRGFDRKTRAPRPLIARLHFPASKLTTGRRKSEDD